MDNRFKGKFFYSDKWLFGAMLFSAGICLVAAFVLSIDSVILAANHDASLSCNISSVISCGTVANSWQASLFGFPNAFLGLVFEPIVLTVATAGLMGTKFKKPFLVFLQFLYLFALIFALWLFTQSAFVIHAFCPWCLLVTLGTILTFFTLFRYNVVNGVYDRLSGISNKLKYLVNVNLDGLIELLLIVTVIGTIFVNYGTKLFS